MVALFAHGSSRIDPPDDRVNVTTLQAEVTDCERVEQVLESPLGARWLEVSAHRSTFEGSVLVQYGVRGKRALERAGPQPLFR